MFAGNLVHFSRVLRDAGLAVGPDRVLAGIAAIEAVGIERREDVRAALAAVMLDRREQQPVFEAAFDAFFRNPVSLDGLVHDGLPTMASAATEPPLARRLAEALARSPVAALSGRADERRVDLAPGSSERERLQRADFESMTTAEFEQAKAIARTLPPPVHEVRLRRHEAAARGSVDLRRTLLAMTHQPQTLAPRFTRARTRLPPLVVLLDISGSMARYSRLFLHYVHGLTRRWLRVHTFTFGTRLTDITRCLRDRDPDVALAKADALVQDWKGGTRIADALAEFNRRWARRVLGGNAALLLVTDGLERGDTRALALEAARLQRSAHEVVWLNPLLRFDGFQPKAAGVRALLPHVDRFLPVHNLASLADLGRALRTPAPLPSSLLH